MTTRKRYVCIGLGIVVLFSFVAVLIVANQVRNRFEPYIREQAIQYLEKRFDCDVRIDALHVEMPKLSIFRLIRTRGHGAVVHVDGTGIAMRLRGRSDVPPLFTMKHFGFDVDLGVLRDNPKIVQRVVIDGMDISVPPDGKAPSDDESEHASEKTGVLIEEVLVNSATLTILSKKENDDPLRFVIHRVRLESAGKDVAMKYDADLMNAMPPGHIVSQGHFGPWNADEPERTPLDGHYDFQKADLSVFDGIAGILASTGDFDGRLGTIDVQGEATVPDFRLKISGNPVPLRTQFKVRVDGTNGDTVLQPVVATLGKTRFTTSGAVLKDKGRHKRSIRLNVDMPHGRLEDLLRLSMKGAPFMEGGIALRTIIVIPPLEGKVREKLLLDGHFEMSKAHFIEAKIQDKIDELSRRGQGDPKNESIDEVVSGMKGRFHLEDQIITFRVLQFAVPGAAIDLAGNYQFDGPIDFHGTMKLQAKLSQTMTGWKRWVLKPVDPFFSKNGAGTFLHIKVAGTAGDPQFGLDR